MSSVTLRWQRYPAGTPEEENRWNRAVIEEFKKRTGVSVEIAGASWDDGLNRIMSAVASGEGPDVIQLAEQWTGQAYSTGAFLPLDDKIDEFGGYEAYYSGALKYGQFGGSTYGLPWGGDCRAFYFRGSILEQAGVIPPDNTWTWDDMRNILLALKGNGFEYPFSMEGSGTQFDVFYFWYYTMLARGGQFLTNNEKTAAINTPAGRKALQDIIDLVLVDKTLSPSMAENDPTMNSAAFINGTALLLPAATGTAAEAEAAGITDVMCQTPPRGPNGEFGAFLAISVQSVFDASKHKDTALEFLRLLMEPEWQISYNKTAGWLPARIEAWDDPYFSQGWRANIRYGMENGTAFMPGNEHAASVCRIMASHLGELYSAVALGTYRSGDVEKTLAAAERAVQAELDR
ncbi:MAG: sugar ABC transporter substrate-binding protein [Treponema sp.]|nr:sugar ABC transporter substrate-binding protein [Treponema sp.]